MKFFKKNKEADVINLVNKKEDKNMEKSNNYEKIGKVVVGLVLGLGGLGTAIYTIFKKKGSEDEGYTEVPSTDVYTELPPLEDEEAPSEE